MTVPRGAQIRPLLLLHKSSIDITTTRRLQMEIFAHFQNLQANLFLRLWSPFKESLGSDFQTTAVGCLLNNHCGGGGSFFHACVAFFLFTNSQGKPRSIAFGFT